MRLALYFHTARYLRPVQVYGRVLHRVLPRRIDLSPPPPIRVEDRTEWVFPAGRKPTMIGPMQFHLLNTEVAVKTPGDWNDASRPKLISYNLHYFDDLNAREADSRRVWHEQLIGRWMAENPAGKGIGWEAYPLSIRVVNWVQWTLSGGRLSEEARNSLAVQTRCLARQMEYYLLGNHLLANAKALVFAGGYFKGVEGDGWLEEGLLLFRTQLREQILGDGGHFERSPMYHSIILCDVLDVLNLLRTFFARQYAHVITELKRIAQTMQDYLTTLCHPDGKIALFNDSAHCIAPSPFELHDYARRLGVEARENSLAAIRYLAESGFCRAEWGQAVLFADVGPIAADYAAGHGHADVLSFELSLFGRRYMVDSGVSVYGESAERLRQKGTSAHNTVIVDGRDSSELWGGFRVARRACPLEVRVEQGEDGLIISAGHDGYRRLPGNVVHRRSWTMSERSLTIVDRLEGTRVHEIAVSFHLHPEYTLEKTGSNEFLVRGEELPAVRVATDPALHSDAVCATYHPEFGLATPSTKIFGSARCQLPANFTTKIDW